VIDCSGRDVHIKGGNGRIEVLNGIVTLRARDLRIEEQRSIQAHRDQSGGPFGMRIELTGRLDVLGFLQAKSDYGGGSVAVQAAGDVAVGNAGGGQGINANATARNSPGGRIAIVSGGDVAIGDPVVADGSSLDVGEGGEISIAAAGDITVGERLSVYGHDADAGTISLTTENGSIDVQGPLKAEGAGQEGNGGGIYLDGQQITVSALLSAQGGLGTGGALSTGGTVRLEAGSGGIILYDDVNVTGGEAGSGVDGGAFVVESRGPVTIASGVDVNTKSDANGGDGGDVLIAAGAALTVGNVTIDARGHWGGTGEGTGARIDLSGCNVSIAPGAMLDARGYNGGAVSIAGRETLAVGAGSTVNVSGAGGEAGSIVLSYRFPGTCSGAPLQGCEVAACMPTGSCSNAPQTPCTTNANCTSGCSTGQCRRICSNDAYRSCTTNAHCTGCASGCTGPNPITTDAVFLPDPPTLEENRNLEPCE
jgi:hypothetical protein